MTPNPTTEPTRPIAGSRPPALASLASLLTPRRTLLAAVSLLTFISLPLAPPAFAAPSRTYLSQLTGTPPSAPILAGPFDEPNDVATDPAGDAWIIDSHFSRFQGGGCPYPSSEYPSSQCPVIDKFGPSGEFLNQGPVNGWPGQGSPEFDSDAFADTANRLYTVNLDSGHGFFALNPDATIETQIPGATSDEFNKIAVDNSGRATDGDIYGDQEGVYGNLPISRVNAAGEPAPFSASASYIGGEEGNQLTGTPEGPFGTISRMAVGPAGELYVVEPHTFIGVPNQSGTIVPTDVVDEFAPSGLFIRQFTGSGVPGGFSSKERELYEYGAIDGVAVDPTNGNVLIADDERGIVYVFDANGNYLEQLTEANGEPFHALNGGIAVNPKGDVYVVDGGEHDYGGSKVITVVPPSVDEFSSSDVSIPEVAYGPVSKPTHVSGTLNATVTPAESGEEITACSFEYGTDPTYSLGSLPCLNPSGVEVGTKANPITSSTEVHAEIAGLTPETTYHYRVVAANPNRTRYGLDEEFTPHNVYGVKTEPPTVVRATTATLAGSFIAQAGIETEYFFEYGTSSSFGHKSPPLTVPGPASGEETKHLTAQIENLAPHTLYRYRIVARNHFGTTNGSELQFTTTQPPTIEALSTSGVTATSAVLHAKINPEGFPTTYRFEYGTTTAYGQTVPQPEGEITAAEDSTSHSVEAEVTGLQRGATYHFRLIAQSSEGTVTSEDQSFEFFPSACPNSAVRQQTGSAYLPDCRAYELVSPANAGGTILFPGGPNTGQATSPSRFSFTGAFGQLPGADTINTGGDLYVSTRTDTGWTTHYIGLPGDQAGCMSGPPDDPTSYVTLDNPTELNNTVLADPSMSHLLNFNDGEPFECSFGDNGVNGADRYVDSPSNAPYLWSSEGALLAHLPTDISEVPSALYALECPYGASGAAPNCTSEVAASAELNHLVFSSNRLSFASPGEPPGLTSAPGSAYDDNLATGKVVMISKLQNGEPIPQGQDGGSGEVLRFPAVSADGSHILISPSGEYYCYGKENGSTWDCPRFFDSPIHLYMSIDDDGAIEVSRSEVTGENVAVNYVGMTEDGSKVFFTSEQHLTAEEPDHAGASLYMWSEEGEKKGHPLTLISRANPGSPAGAGDTAACQPPNVRAIYAKPYDGHPEGETNAPWTKKCGVLPFSAFPYSTANGGFGGNGISDSGIASRNGDIYFFSPEQLAGDRGVPNQANLYDYREGSLHYVITLNPENHCIVTGFVDEEESRSGKPNLCSAGPIARMEVTPNDNHMAFLTASRVTSYENAGHLEMYSYTPATESLTCDSCNPDGRPATADVAASEDGLFLTEDGRTFFSTTEALLSQDTDEGEDVYEYVDGRPRLITPGTGTATASEVTGLGLVDEVPGLIGVSANGTDVYFSTFDSLISEDQNGDFLRFYDARTDGGFPLPPPNQPCAAAEECHGPGTESPTLPKLASNGPATTGGNATPEHHIKHHKKHKRAKHKRHHTRAAHKHGGKK